jgi:hypothetical protein
LCFSSTQKETVKEAASDNYHNPENAMANGVEIYLHYKTNIPDERYLDFKPKIPDKR